MPIYEYRCSACGARVERMQRITEKPLSDCPVCQAKGSLHKLISHSSFHLKGSGWYVTDYSGKKTGVVDGNGHAAAANGNGNGHGGSADAVKETAPSATTEKKEKKTGTTSTDN